MECGNYEKDIKEFFLAEQTIKKFIWGLEIVEQKKKVYKWFLKSAENIAQDCIDSGFTSSKDYLRDLISSKRLANYYLTGKISKYWLSGIPTFKKIITKLDQLSQDEFHEIYERFDLYNTEINEAFLQEKQCKVNPIRYTD